MPLSYLKKHWAGFFFFFLLLLFPQNSSLLCYLLPGRNVFSPYISHSTFFCEGRGCAWQEAFAPSKRSVCKVTASEWSHVCTTVGRPYLLHGTTVDNLCLVAKVGLAVKSRGRWLGQISVPCVGSGGFVGLPRGSGKGCVCLCLGTESSWALQLF